MTAALIMAGALLVWSGWVWWREPAAPVFDPAARLRVVEEQIKTPAGAWDAWIEFYRPMSEHGIPLFRLGNPELHEAQMTHARFLRWMLWAVASICAVIALCAAYWPRSVPAPARQG